MPRLSTQNSAQLNGDIVRPGYDRDAAGIGIVHIGPGAFHRAHQAVFTDMAMEKSGGDWGICGLSLNSRDTAKNLTAQDGKLANRAVFVLAGWIALNRTRRTSGHPPTDAFLTHMQADLPDPALSPENYAAQFLNMTEVLPAGIGQNKIVRPAVIAATQQINTHSLRIAMAALI